MEKEMKKGKNGGGPKSLFISIVALPVISVGLSLLAIGVILATSTKPPFNYLGIGMEVASLILLMGVCLRLRPLKKKEESEEGEK